MPRARTISRAVPLAVLVVAAVAVTTGAAAPQPALPDDVIPEVLRPPIPPALELPTDPGSSMHQPSPAGPGSAGMYATAAVATNDPAATPAQRTASMAKAVARTTPATVVAAEAANTSTSERESPLPLTGVAAALVLALIGAGSLGTGPLLRRLTQP